MTGGGGLRMRPRLLGLQCRLEIPSPPAAPPGGGSDSVIFQSDLTLSPQNFL